MAAYLEPPLTDPAHARLAVYALWATRPESEQTILLLTNAFKRAPHEVLAALGDFESQASGAMPLLISVLRATNSISDPILRASASVAVARMGTQDAEIIALIAENLDGPNLQGYAPTHEICLWALGRIGPAARSELPRIKRRLGDSNPAVRKAAQEAIGRIDVP